MSFPPHTAWDMFKSLNNFFEESEAWRKYDIGIRKKLKDRMIEKEQKQDKMIETVKEAATKPTAQNILNLEFVNKKETNIDKNYGPNIEHNGGTLSLPGESRDT